MVVGEQLEVIAGRLADVLVEPLSDPMMPEWIVAPSYELNRWLRLHLASRLGASTRSLGDGIAANMELIYPSRLTRRLLVDPRAVGPSAVAPSAVGSQSDESDRWAEPCLAWTINELLHGASGDFPGLTALPPGATSMARASHIASLFNGYAIWRPEMVDAWQSDRNIDANGGPLPDRLKWQPELWRRVCSRIGPPTVVSDRQVLITCLGEGTVGDWVPERISLFGLRLLPGASAFMKMIEALATVRDVRLYMTVPSLKLADAVREAIQERSNNCVGIAYSRTQLFLDDVFAAASKATETPNPLLRAWAGQSAELLALLGVDRIKRCEGVQGVANLGELSLLQEIQADLRLNRMPENMRAPVSANDRSIRLHRCHGPGRQVEVLRDEILHLLANPSSPGGAGLFTEDDIVVLCPDIGRFRPLIEATWGRAQSGEQDTNMETPKLRYRVVGDSHRFDSPSLDALAALVELAASRVSDVGVVDFISREAVRNRFRFTDDDLSRIAKWIKDANTCWGLSAAHRSAWWHGVTGDDAGQFPEDLEVATFGNLRDRLLLGIATTDYSTSLALGELLPIAIEGDEISLVGRFVELLWHLERLVDRVFDVRPLEDWLHILAEAAQALLVKSSSGSFRESQVPDSAFPDSAVGVLLDTLRRNADTGDGPSKVRISFTEFRALIGRQVGAGHQVASVVDGGISVLPLSSYWGTPHKVICLLGMDEASFGGPSPDGDDLVTEAPRLGDLDRHDGQRLNLLNAVLSAQTNLVMTCSGWTMSTNEPIPQATVLSEFLEMVRGPMGIRAEPDPLDSVVIDHPRHIYDPRNFKAGEIDSGIEGASWSFDKCVVNGLRESRKHAETYQTPSAFRSGSSDDSKCVSPQVIDLADLRRFLKSPVEFYLKNCVGMRVPSERDASNGRQLQPASSATGLTPTPDGRNLSLTIDGLERWKLREAVLAECLKAEPGMDPDLSILKRRLKSVEQFATKQAFDEAMEEAHMTATELIGALDRLSLRSSVVDVVDVEVDICLNDGTRIVGVVPAVNESEKILTKVTVSTFKSWSLLQVWLDLLVLGAHQPENAWQGNLVARSTTRNQIDAKQLSMSKDHTDRSTSIAASLDGLITLFRRGCREPLPIFEKVSGAFFDGTPKPAAWDSSFQVPGDRFNQSVSTVFGHLDFFELMTLPPDEDDRLFEQSRELEPLDGKVELLARCLWSLVDEVAIRVDLSKKSGKGRK